MPSESVLKSDIFYTIPSQFNRIHAIHRPTVSILAPVVAAAAAAAANSNANPTSSSTNNMDQPQQQPQRPPTAPIPHHPNDGPPPMLGNGDEMPGDIRAFFEHPLVNGEDNQAPALALLHEYQNLPAIDHTDNKIRDKYDTFSDILR